MARTPVNWNPNRYGSVKHVLKFDATTGTYSLQEQEQNYNNTYNFASLSSGNTQTQTSTNTTTQQTGTTSAQTTQAFGDVRPLYAQKDDNDPFSAEYGKGTATDANTVGFNVDNNKNSFPDFPDISEAQQKYNEFQNAPYRMGADTPVGKQQLAYEKGLNEQILSHQEKARTGQFGPSYIKAEKPTGLLSNVKSKLGDVKSKMIDPAIQVAKSVFKTPAMMMIDAIAGEETVINKHDKQYFTAYTSGSMSGRITGDDGTYDPSNNLYHGMNRVSMHGNLEKAGAKRIARIERTIAKKKAKGQDTTTLEKRVANFKGEQKEYTQSKITAKHKSDLATGGVAPGASSGGTGGGSGPEGGKSIICTQMYQQTQLEDWKKTMQLWYIFQKKYLTMEHQEGYHFLFKPFVNGMKKSKILTTLGKHCAIARTNDIKHIMFGTPFSLSGRLVRLVTEPICYITGKIKSWL